tara:strand:+ start:586 stop:699 length:114 start_codon:yes stop_codon:yes gene_type:complete
MGASKRGLLAAFAVLGGLLGIGVMATTAIRRRKLAQQ